MQLSVQRYVECGPEPKSIRLARPSPPLVSSLRPVHRSLKRLSHNELKLWQDSLGIFRSQACTTPLYMHRALSLSLFPPSRQPQSLIPRNSGRLDFSGSSQLQKPPSPGPMSDAYSIHVNIWRPCKGNRNINETSNKAGLANSSATQPHD